ncbi:hypothetical protein F2Q68_00010762 [Brassica cretica]|uniref:Uncharacterized protein n=1 Tax=Brassica cretica TaxID=69181 RepID=A0A8S9KPX4_BRACR|nr:hypothetical protein F2Q68_00010762 [Brassica cretica]
MFGDMVVSPGRSSSLQSIKGVSQLWSKLKPFKKKAFPLFLKLVTWSCEERWNLLCCGVKEEVMNTRRRCWVTIQLSYPLDLWPVTKEAQGTSSGSLVSQDAIESCSMLRNEMLIRFGYDCARMFTGCALCPSSIRVEEEDFTHCEWSLGCMWIHKASGHHLKALETGGQKALEIKGRVDPWLKRTL